MLNWYRFLLLIIYFSFFDVNVSAQPGEFSELKKKFQSVTSLCGYQWKMKMMLPGEGERQGLQNIYPEDIETLVWNPANVPGDVYTDLWKAGVIDDPYYGRNSVK